MDDKDKVRRQFGDHAQEYVKSTVHSQGFSIARMVELTHPRADWVVLDVSTGGGHTALAFATHVARVIATDLTSEMLTVAEKFVRENGVQNVEFKFADAEALPFSDGEFDLVTNRIALHHFPDARQAIFEAARVLKPGGKFALADNIVPPDKVTAGYINQFEKMRDPSHHWCYPQVRLEALLSDAGLTVMHGETFAKELDLEDWARRMGHTDEMLSRLATRLSHAPDPVKAVLNPREVNGKLKFSLTEAILIGQRAPVF